jgi:UDP:flavonoid glycosyltransferase YjiC (YdhE family)
MLRQKFKEQKIHQKFQINTQKVFNPTFNNVEEWFLIPQELDFPQQQLLPWQKYVESMVMTDRQENLEANYLNFIKKKETYPNSKLLYCSLGTVLKSHLVHRKGDIYTFFNAIIDIAFENPSLYFVIALEKSMRSTLKTTSENIIFLDYAPQIDILSKADVFLTHAYFQVLYLNLSFKQHRCFCFH